MDRRLPRHARDSHAIGLVDLGCISPTDPFISRRPASANRMYSLSRAASITSLETATSVPPSSPPRPATPAPAADLSATHHTCGRPRHAPRRQLRVGTHLGDS
eukprot:3894971-Prymnesium_polylepis.1